MNKDEIITDDFLKQFKTGDELNDFMSSIYKRGVESILQGELEGMDLDYRNRDFHRKMTQGVSVSWKDAHGKENAKHIYPIKRNTKNMFNLR